MSGARRHPYLAVPEEWELVEQSGPRPFVTLSRWRRPDGAIVTWRSRAHRKHPSAEVSRWWWAPAQLGWWIGVLFAVGASCFLVASVPAYVDAFGSFRQAVTYFVGSIFFTAAATLQFEQTQSAGVDPSSPATRRAGGRFALGVRRIDWWAAVVQVAGTLLFNRSTWFAMWNSESAAGFNRLVWVPDAAGSICFLVASWLAWAEVCDGAWRWRPATIGWWVAASNLLGSVAFGLSAVGALAVGSGAALSEGLATGGTLAGAACFLAGALLLLPELRTASTETGVDAAGPVQG
ncbi:MAG: hypothetical protein AAFX58_12125 [Pseudomonadota bacterium]